MSEQRLECEIEYCRECKRYFDVRSGCETDIRYDEGQRIAKLLAEILPKWCDGWLHDTPGPMAEILKKLSDLHKDGCE